MYEVINVKRNVFFSKDLPWDEDTWAKSSVVKSRSLRSVIIIAFLITKVAVVLEVGANPREGPAGGVPGFLVNTDIDDRISSMDSIRLKFFHES